MKINKIYIKNFNLIINNQEESEDNYFTSTEEKALKEFERYSFPK